MWYRRRATHMWPPRPEASNSVYQPSTGKRPLIFQVLRYRLIPEYLTCVRQSEGDVITATSLSPSPSTIPSSINAPSLTPGNKARLVVYVLINLYLLVFYRYGGPRCEFSLSNFGKPGINLIDLFCSTTV
ncbi:hypothetical protein J6590_009746 [Homalodisca vitripennis]|nr:hypothetical protein J6590_009746 [Homalodisca vitripennis]